MVAKKHGHHKTQHHITDYVSVAHKSKAKRPAKTGLRKYEDIAKQDRKSCPCSVKSFTQPAHTRKLEGGGTTHVDKAYHAPTTRYFERCETKRPKNRRM
jgi:hypothetical protein